MVELLLDKDFGEVTVYRTNKAKRMLVRLTPRGVRVSAPPYVPRTHIRELLNQNRNQISEALSRIQDRIQMIEPGFQIESECFTFRVCDKAEQECPQLEFKDGVALLSLPIGYDCGRKAFQDWAKEALVKIMQQRVKTELGPRLQELSVQRQIPYARLYVSRARTKWASCSTRRTISLNAFMILLPRHLQDFVLQHELTHLLEMNHGPRFHELLNNCVNGREAELDGELNAFELPAIFL